MNLIFLFQAYDELMKAFSERNKVEPDYTGSNCFYCLLKSICHNICCAISLFRTSFHGR